MRRAEVDKEELTFGSCHPHDPERQRVDDVVYGPTVM